jgi:fatty-acid desaturase
MIVENPNTKRAPRARIAAPATARPYKILPGYFVAIIGLHLAALLVFVPWFFSWTGVVLFVAGHYVFGMLGMTLCYHRLLTHRGFTCSKRFEHFLALLGVCCLQDSPARWVAVHRKHHQHSDEEEDPHSPLVAAFWGHFGWLMAENREHSSMAFYEKYARDILRDPFYFYLERRLMWLWVYLAHAALFFVVGFAAGWIWTGYAMGGVQLGASWLIWGVVARTVFVWHVTWSVNSLTHLWGSRRFETDDNSRNNWLVGVLAHGEGWHNNHHADPVSAAHGMRWWELDFTYWTICALETMGLASNVVRPRIEE